MNSRIRPCWVVALYCTLVVISTAIYRLWPDLLNENLGWIDSFYFSVVTITTLGYGEIHPTSPVGKFVVISETLGGVAVLGFFLIVVAQNIAEAQERKRIEAAKENIIAQYKNWRISVARLCFVIARPKEPYDLEFIKKLVEPEEFRSYFGGESDKHWYEFSTNLSTEDPFYPNELNHEIELLQYQIDQFVVLGAISDSNLLQRLCNASSGLARLRRLDIDDYEQNKTFCRQLWGMMVLFDHVEGQLVTDPFLGMVQDA